MILLTNKSEATMNIIDTITFVKKSIVCDFAGDTECMKVLQ